MNNNLKIYLIAGEPSGDALGARLMRAIKKKTGGKAEFFGIGGDTMEKEGMSSLFDISELAIMGLCEVIPSIPRVLKRIGQTVNDIVRLHPDVVISIDSWSFGSRVQKKTACPQNRHSANSLCGTAGLGLEKETRPYHVQIR